MNSNFTGQVTEKPTSVCVEEVDTATVKIIKTFAYCIMLVLALGGNILLVSVVSLQRKLRTTTNCLICNMAISDLLVPIFAMPRTIVEIHLGLRRWLVAGTLGLALCKVIYFLQDVSTAVSVLSLSCITIDRFYAVVRPESSTPIKGHIKAVITGIWSTAMLMHAPYFYTFQLVVKHNQGTFCFLIWPKTVDRELAMKCFFLSLIVLLYFIPLFLIAILQGMIVNRLRKQRLPSFSSSLRQRKRGKRNKNVVYFTLAVIVIFFVCWTPTVVYSFIVIYRKDICIPELFRFASLFLVQSNSSLNFFVYFIFNHNFRKTFKKLFLGRIVRIMRRAETIQLPVRHELKTLPSRNRTITVETLSDQNNDFQTFNSEVALKEINSNNKTFAVSEEILSKNIENEEKEHDSKEDNYKERKKRMLPNACGKTEGCSASLEES